MKQDLHALLDSSEKIRVNQDKIIDNQKKQIETLQAMNEKLEAELTEVHTYVRELTKDYNEVVSMCKEQQAILNSLSNS